MEIKILKNASNFDGLHLKEGMFLQKDISESEFDEIKQVHYYLNNIYTGERTEILPNIEKYDVGRIINASPVNEYLYFVNIFKNEAGVGNVSIIRYNYENMTTESLYSFEDNIEEYSKIKRLKLFVLNDLYIFMQKEQLVYNAKKTYTGFLKFDLKLINLKDSVVYDITDENLCNNGLSDVIYISENQYIIKTGFSMLKDNRYNEFEQEEASLETVGFINIGQILSDFVIGQNKINIQVIDQAYYIKTIHYIKKEGSYLIYSLIDNELKEEEIKFYNLETEEVYSCINKDVIRESDIANTIIMNDEPYIYLVKEDEISFLNIVSGKIDVKFDEGLVMNKIFNNSVIMSGLSKKTLFMGSKPYFEVYSFPGKELLCHETGEYVDSFMTEDECIYININ